jgi:hypothetical protein
MFTSSPELVNVQRLGGLLAIASVLPVRTAPAVIVADCQDHVVDPR